jgi:hypothetical protein
MAKPTGKQAEKPSGGAGGPLGGLEAARKAREHLAQLTGCACESVSGLARTEAGWSVTVEVVELERIPHTTDVLASYVVDLDARGDLTGYRRAGRYSRGQALDGSEGRP